MRLEFIVFAAPMPGREAEFFAWYDEVHMRHMLALEGIRSVRRYTVVQEPDRPAAPGSSLAVFEWEVEDAATARAILGRAQRDNVIPLHDSMDRTRTRSWFVEPVYHA